MTNNADNVSGQAPSLLPTGRQGSSGESVSILRDLDPRSAKLGATSSFPFKTVLLVVAPLAIGVTLLSSHLNQSTRGEAGGRSPASTQQPSMVAAHEAAAIPTTPMVEGAPSAPAPAVQEGQGPATILTHPDPGGGEKGQPQANPLGILAKDNVGRSPTSTSATQNNTTGKVEGVATRKSAKHTPNGKTAATHHAAKIRAKNKQARPGQKKRMEQEIDIVTAIVKGTPN